MGHRLCQISIIFRQVEIHRHIGGQNKLILKQTVQIYLFTMCLIAKKLIIICLFVIFRMVHQVS